MAPLASDRGDPIWAVAQEAGVSVSFHVGGGSMGTQFQDTANMSRWRAGSDGSRGR